jgi:hypothetical protein
VSFRTTVFTEQAGNCGGTGLKSILTFLYLATQTHPFIQSETENQILLGLHTIV